MTRLSCERGGEIARRYCLCQCADHYVRHTNRKGLYSEQETAKVAQNTVHLQHSVLILSKT